MRILILVFFTLFIYQSSTEKTFEGELIYHHDMRVGSIDYSESRKYFDTLKITYKNKNFIKLTNKKNYEKIFFIDASKKRFVIYSDKSVKSNNLSMYEDNLNFGKFYNRENSHFGTIISVYKSDTIFNFNDKDHQLKKLFVERKYGNETYVFSETDSLKLADNRNILRNIGEQIHPREIAAELNNSILYYYKLKANIFDNVYEEYRLVEKRNKEIENIFFEIPEHKDAKGFKRENKKKRRFKFYELTE